MKNLLSIKFIDHSPAVRLADCQCRRLAAGVSPRNCSLLPSHIRRSLRTQAVCPCFCRLSARGKSHMQRQIIYDLRPIRNLMGLKSCMTLMSAFRPPKALRARASVLRCISIFMSILFYSSIFCISLVILSILTSLFQNYTEKSSRSDRRSQHGRKNRDSCSACSGVQPPLHRTPPCSRNRK